MNTHPAEKWFFPAAALYGAVAIPLSVHGMMTGNPVLPGFVDRTGHVHELFFGYALAVVAGFLVNKTSAARLALLFGLWLAARATYLLWPENLFTVAANLAFAGLLAATVTPKFMKGAKKLRNKTFAPLILAIVLVLAVFHIAGLVHSTNLRTVAIGETIMLFALLMLLMGGRIIAPAAAGAIRQAGGHLEPRVQPRIEGTVLVAMVFAVLSAPIPVTRPGAGIALLMGSFLAAVRLMRWRVWRCKAHLDLLCLGAGYAWLALGIGLLGGSYTFGAVDQALAAHAITVGALGTLTTTVMARTRMLRVKREPSAARWIPLIALAIGLAAVSRIVFGDTLTGLVLAACLWSGGLLLLVVVLFRFPVR